MSKSNNSSYAIINGRRVHADTGHSIDGLMNVRGPKASTVAHHLDLRPAKPPVIEPKKTDSTKSIDGFSVAQAASPAIHRSSRTVNKAVNVHRRVNQSKPRPSQVQQAKLNPTPTIQLKKPVAHHLNIAGQVDPVAQSSRLTEHRSMRAANYRQSQSITKFGKLHHNLVAPEAKEKPQPIEDELRNVSEIKLVNDNDDLKDLVESLSNRPIANINQQIAQHHRRHIEAELSNNNFASKPNFAQRLRDLLTVQRFAGAFASLLVVATLAGYVAYLNAPNVAFRVAASRAGIEEAKKPGYVPSGFALDNPIQYGDGKLVMKYTSKSDSRFFRLTEEKSLWDSKSLLENYVIKESNSYDVIEEGGLTIYVYNGSSATWVNQGLRYTIDGQSLLSQDQIAKFAASL